MLGAIRNYPGFTAGVVAIIVTRGQDPTVWTFAGLAAISGFAATSLSLHLEHPNLMHARILNDGLIMQLPSFTGMIMVSSPIFIFALVHVATSSKLIVGFVTIEYNVHHVIECLAHQSNKAGFEHVARAETLRTVHTLAFLVTCLQGHGHGALRAVMACKYADAVLAKIHPQWLKEHATLCNANLLGLKRISGSRAYFLAYLLVPAIAVVLGECLVVYVLGFYPTHRRGMGILLTVHSCIFFAYPMANAVGAKFCIGAAVAMAEPGSFEFFTSIFVISHLFHSLMILSDRQRHVDAFLYPTELLHNGNDLILFGVAHSSSNSGAGCTAREFSYLERELRLETTDLWEKYSAHFQVDEFTILTQQQVGKRFSCCVSDPTILPGECTRIVHEAQSLDSIIIVIPARHAFSTVRWARIFRKGKLLRTWPVSKYGLSCLIHAANNERLLIELAKE